MRPAAAAFLLAAIVGACGTPTPTARPSVRPTPTAVASATHTAATDPMMPPTPEPTSSTPTAAISLGSAPEVPFAGDLVTLTIDAYLALTDSSIEVASATVDFGDGSTGTTTGSCAADATIDHAYTDGDYQPTVIAVSTCGLATTADLSHASTPIHVLPAASLVSATWPTCSTFQLHLTGESFGTMMGNGRASITLQNISRAGCKLQGYPGVQLVAPDGRLLPTTVQQATGGAYTFPPVVPHRVALGPGGFASFDLSYAGNPSGAAADEPYAVACPSSAWVRVILPGTREYGTAAVAMGACGGDVGVSPVVPGPNGFSF
jgi:hypothetical protein